MPDPYVSNDFSILDPIPYFISFGVMMLIGWMVSKRNGK